MPLPNFLLLGKSAQAEFLVRALSLGTVCLAVYARSGERRAASTASGVDCRMRPQRSMHNGFEKQ